MKLSLLLLLSIPACAQKPDYQPGTFKSLRMIQAGKYCHTTGDTNGTVNANTDGYGTTTGRVDATTNSSTSCSPRRQYLYTVTVGQQTYVLTPKEPAKKVGLAIATLGYSRFFEKDSVLYGQLPGSAIQIRSESGAFHVKVGKRESLYSLVAAE